MNLTDEHYHPVEPSFMGHLKEILRFSWFSRMWVLQEFWLPRIAVMLWGHTELNANSVQSWACHMAADRGAKHRTWFSLLTASIRTNVQLLSTLHATRSLLCADDRDRVYALLGLPYDSHFPLSEALLSIEPDYTRSVESLFLHVACLCIENREVSRLLDQIDHNTESCNGLPSWVPDWNHPSRSDPLQGEVYDGIQYASKNYAVVDQAAGILTVRGIELDHIRTIMPEVLDPYALTVTLDAIARYWCQIFGPLEKRLKSTGCLEYITAELEFLCLLCKKDGGIQYVVQDWSQPTALFVDFVDEDSEVLDRHVRGSPLLMRMVLSLTRSLKVTGPKCFKVREKLDSLQPHGIDHFKWRGRRLFQTDQGYTGLGPGEMRTGDRVAMFPAYKDPFLVIVRKMGDHYIFVGTAYVPALHGYGWIADRYEAQNTPGYNCPNSGLQRFWSERHTEVKEYVLK